MRKIPLSSYYASELVPLFKKEMEMCNVKAGENVIIFTDTEFTDQYPAACSAALEELGANVVRINVPSTMSTKDLDDNKVLLNAWKSADMVIGMTVKVGWLYSNIHNEALKSGTRTLMCEEAADCLRRLLPDREVRRRGEAGAKVLEKGKTIKVTSKAGTYLTMSKDGRKASAQYGLADVPGRWDNWPSGLVACAPVEGTVEGTLVLDVGDIILMLGIYVQTPVKITIEKGRITKFEGGFEAKMLEDYFKEAKEENAYVVSHIGWGTDHRASWNAMHLKFWERAGMMDAESFYGNMQIAFGSNFSFNMEGKNVCSFHLDIPCRNHSFWVDDELIVDEGVILPENLR